MPVCVCRAGAAVTAGDQLQKLLDLGEDWDSHGGRPVAAGAFARATLLLELLRSHGVAVRDIVPTASGGLQLEWLDDAVECERQTLLEFVTGEE